MFTDKDILLLGERIRIEDYQKYRVVGIISGERIEGLQTYPYDYLVNKPKDTKLIIVDDNWDFKILYEFNVMMSNLGLYIGEDYIYHSMLGVKIDTNRIYYLLDRSIESFHMLMRKIIGNREFVVLHGNCQTYVLRNMLSSNQEFQRKFVTCEMPCFWHSGQMDEYNTLIESKVLGLADYLFTQNVSDTNRFGHIISTDYIISQLSTACNIITISNLYFQGYFLQLQKYSEEKVVIDWWRQGEKRKFRNYEGFTDQEVLKLMMQGKSDEEILDAICSDEYYAMTEVRAKIEDELENFRLREERDAVEIRMSDFLVKNYDNFLMFAIANHPTRNVLIELSKRILRKLEIEDTRILCNEDEVQKPCPQRQYYPIYPSVLKILGFKERSYQLLASLHGCELPVLSGINEILDKFVEENRDKNEVFELDSNLDFRGYMLIYIRILRGAIRI